MFWTPEEVEILRSAYAGVELSGDIQLDALAAQLGRHKTNVCRKARKLMLTDNSRKSVRQHKDRRLYPDAESLSRARSENAKRIIRENGHPRGMAGKAHSDKTKAVLRTKGRAAQAMVSEDERSRRVTQAMRETVRKRGSIAPPRPNASWKAGWREIGGYRKYYRSRWEANYARYLEWLRVGGVIKDWKHEPETFWFEAIKRGVRSYLPDFRVWENDGRTFLHEVKGWMDSRSKTTLARMAKYHPDERIILIVERDYNSIARTVCRMIEGWEYSAKGQP